MTTLGVILLVAWAVVGVAVGLVMSRDSETKAAGFASWQSWGLSLTWPLMAASWLFMYFASFLLVLWLWSGGINADLERGKVMLRG